MHLLKRGKFEKLVKAFFTFVSNPINQYFQVAI